MSKRKAVEPAPRVTINNFFGKVEGPTQVTTDPDWWLDKEVPWSRPTMRLRNGELRAKCNHEGCKHPLSLPHFKPKQNPRHEAEFETAFVKYEAARLTRNVKEMDEAREVLERRKVATCTHHRAIEAKSNAKGPNCQGADCNRAWQELQATKFAKCGKCGATRAVEAHHVDPKGERDANNKKVHSVSDYPWWACHGGVPALRAEAAKCEPLCKMCHTIEETSDSGNRCTHPDDYPVVSRKDDKKAYDARLKAQIKYPKQQYVDNIKRHLKGCAHLGCPGNEGPDDWVNNHPQCGDFDHIDRADKKISISEIVHSLTRVPVAEWKAAIDKELPKCRLLCKNCHFLRKKITIETIPRDQYLAKIEAAIAHATALI
jgi:Zn ribbon nucleic-acid-binding protein